MLFTSYEFIFFVLILFVLYYVLPKKLQQPLLLVASVIFYLTAGVKLILYLAAAIVSVWLGAIIIENISIASKEEIKSQGEGLSREEKKSLKKKFEKKKTAAVVAVTIINLGMLAFTKYTPFVVSSLSENFHFFSDSTVKTFTGLAIPMGISFYTLQSLGYLIDVKRGTIKAQRNPFKFALFISFFPIIVQGPISNYAKLSETLYSPHEFSSKNVSFGLQRMLWGYFKKLVIADRLSAGVMTLVGSPDEYRGGYALFLIFLYTAQLYADFTGGIDITIGTAEVLGIRLEENFIRPYFTVSLKEYWRHWHITMCDWFKNYIFYPISVSPAMSSLKKFCTKHIGKYAGKRIPVYLASLVVWGLTGIWHGATLNFLTWGLLNWIILMVSEELEPKYQSFHEKHAFSNGKGYKVFMMIRTFLLISVLNLFDCFSNVKDTFGLIGSIFVTPNYNVLVNGSLLNIGLDMSDYIVAIIGIVIMFAVSLLSIKKPVREQIAEKPYIVRAVIWSALFIAIIIFGHYGIGYDASQFIYNRF